MGSVGYGPTTIECALRLKSSQSYDTDGSVSIDVVCRKNRVKSVSGVGVCEKAYSNQRRRDDTRWKDN